MINLSTLLGFASLSGDVLKARMIRRLMKDVVSVIALAVATGFMAGALLIGLAYLAYQELVQAGLDPIAALVVLLILGACFIISMARITGRKLSQLKRMRQQSFSGGDMNDRLSVLLDHFIDGFAGNRRR